MSLSCCKQRLSELFGGRLCVLPKLDVGGRNLRTPFDSRHSRNRTCLHADLNRSLTWRAKIPFQKRRDDVTVTHSEGLSDQPKALSTEPHSPLFNPHKKRTLSAAGERSFGTPPEGSHVTAPGRKRIGHREADPRR